MGKEFKMTLTTNHEEQKKIGNKYILPFIPKKNLKDEGIKKRNILESLAGLR